MDKRTHEASLRKELHGILQTFLHSKSPSPCEKMEKLASKCFPRACSPICRRHYCLCIIVSALNQSDRPYNLDTIVSLIQGVENPEEEVFKGIFFTTELKLALIGGLVEARSLSTLSDSNQLLIDSRHVRTTILTGLQIFVKVTTPDVTCEAIEIFIKYLKQYLTSSNDHVADEEMVLIQSMCHYLQCMWNVSEIKLVTLVSSLFECIFELHFSRRLQSTSFSDWITSHLIHEYILGAPHCLEEATILPKGSLRMLKVLLKHAPLTWIFDQSTHLTTSLLLSLAWNYTAALTGDLLNHLFTACASEIDRWISLVLRPVFNFLMHGLLACSKDQQLRGLNESNLTETTKLRLMNFLVHCGRSPLACLPSVKEKDETNDAHSTFVEWIVNQLVVLLEVQSRKTEYAICEHRFVVLASLIPLMSHTLAEEVSKKHFNLISVGLTHSSDLIRVKFLAATCHLVTIVKATNQRRQLHRLALSGLSSLFSCPEPALRSAAIQSFKEMSFCLRNRCALPCDDCLPQCLPLTRSSYMDGYPDVFDVIGTPAAERGRDDDPSAVKDMSEIIRFACSLWAMRKETNNLLSEKSLQAVQTDVAGSVSPFLAELLSDALIPPGMPYQRQVMLVKLIEHLFDLVYFSTDSKTILCFGFSADAAERLQARLDTLMTGHGFPSPRSQSTWMQVISSLPNLNIALHSNILSLMNTYWPIANGDVFTSASMRDDLMTLAECWCDFHVAEVYSAGSTLLRWLLNSCPPPPEYTISLRLVSKLKEICRETTPVLDYNNLATTTTGEASRIMRLILRSPGHGFLTAVDDMLAWGVEHLPMSKFPGCIVSMKSVDKLAADKMIRLGALTSTHLAESCLQLSNTCMVLMGCPTLDQEGNQAEFGKMSFETVGRTIINFAEQASQQSQEAPTSATVAIRLLPEYQHVLSWAWKHLKMTSRVLVGWVQVRIAAALLRVSLDEDNSAFPQLDTQSMGLFRVIGNQLIHILMSCRHKGTVESVCVSLQNYLTIAAQLEAFETAPDPSQVLAPVRRVLQQLIGQLIRPEQVIRVCLDAVSDRKFSVTRRSAGLWPASKAALSAELQASPFDQVLLHHWLASLYTLASGVKSPEDGDFKNDPPHALALHLLKGVFGDARLGASAYASPLPPSISSPDCDWLTLLACTVALPGFAAPQWTIANGSLQLFASILTRLIGPMNHRPAVHICEVFGRFEILFEAFVNALSVRSQPTESAKLLVPLLSLLSRLTPDAAFSEEKKARMRSCVRPLLGHPVSKIRRLASEVFIVFLPISSSVEAHAVVLSRVGQLPLLIGSGDTSGNVVTDGFSQACSGQLYTLKAWLQIVPTQYVAVLRASLFNWLNSVHILKRWVDVGCWYLAGQMANVMRTVFILNPQHNSTAWKPQFDDLCRDLRLSYFSRLDKLSTEPLFIDFYTHFTDLYNTVQASKDELGLLTLSASSEVLQLHLLTNAVSLLPDLIPVTARILKGPSPAPPLIAALFDAFHGSVGGGGGEAKIYSKSLMLAVMHVTSGMSRVQAEAICPQLLLLLTSVCLDEVCEPLLRRQCVDWWFARLTRCLSPTANQHSRETAMIALLRWLDASPPTPGDVLPSSPSLMRVVRELSSRQRFSLLSLLFSALLDEELPLVRSSAGRAVAMLVLPRADVVHPLCTSAAMRLLLSSLLSRLLQTSQQANAVTPTSRSPYDWLLTCWRARIDELRARVVDEEEVRVTNILYIPDSLHSCFDVQLVLMLLFDALKSQSASDQQMAELREIEKQTAKILNRTDSISVNDKSLRLTVTAVCSSTLYHTSLAQDLMTSLPVL